MIALSLVKVRRIEVEALSVYAELRIGNASLAEKHDLLAAAEGVDDRRPLLERRVVRELHHFLEFILSAARRTPEPIASKMTSMDETSGLGESTHHIHGHKSDSRSPLVSSKDTKVDSHQPVRGNASGRYVTELTGPSHTVTAVTTALSSSTARVNSSWNQAAMFSAEGLMRSKGATSLMQP